MKIGYCLFQIDMRKCCQFSIGTFTLKIDLRQTSFKNVFGVGELTTQLSLMCYSNCSAVPSSPFLRASGKQKSEFTSRISQWLLKEDYTLQTRGHCIYNRTVTVEGENKRPEYITRFRFGQAKPTSKEKHFTFSFLEIVAVPPPCKFVFGFVLRPGLQPQVGLKLDKQIRLVSNSETSYLCLQLKVYVTKLDPI